MAGEEAEATYGEALVEMGDEQGFQSFEVGEDALWMEGGLYDAYMIPCQPSDLAGVLTERGYVVARTTFHPDLCSAAVSETEGLTNSVDDFKQETVVDYLGHDNCTLAYRLEDNEDTEAEALSYLAGLLTQLAMQIGPSLDGITVEPVMVRTPFKSRMDELMARVTPLDWEDREKKTVERSIEFLKRRKLCLLLLLESEGGTLTLHPSSSERSDIEIEAIGNRLVLFDPKAMSYTFKPDGDGLLLQTWLLGHSLVNSSDGCEIELRIPSDLEAAQLVAARGTPVPEGDHAYVMAAKMRGPGNSVDPFLYWNVFCVACDCAGEWPQTRWDPSLYWHDESDGQLARDMGKSYTNHASFISFSQMFDFDHEFFGYAYQDSQRMAPSHRLFLEIGYDTLHATGFRRATTINKDIGIYNGDVGADWHTVTADWNNYNDNKDDPFEGMLGVHTLVLPGRLARFCNLTGPIMTCSTACSSSLVAMSHAVHEMPDFPRSYLVSGINTMLAPVNFILFASATMLSHNGRSFTYNDTADGFMRGEGLGTTYVQWCTDGYQPETAWACIAGTFSNQDGRSASMTAPHGPSQSKLIKTSLRMSKLVADDVNIAECHGTGTALGDPIEVGAIQSAIGKRKLPFHLTSAKSIHGHLEPGAGILGFIKCLIMIRGSACPGNCHFKSINPNLMFEGYPCMVASDIVPVGYLNTCCGVSSFGATGTNGRVDVIGACTMGSKSYTSPESKLARIKDAKFISKPCPLCLRQMHWLDGTAKPDTPDEEWTHTCNLSRSVGADYDCCSICYGGEQQLADMPEASIACPEGSVVWISGSWDNWKEAQEMEMQEDGTFTFDIVMGETCQERFKLCVDNDSERSLYPAATDANAFVGILGPGPPDGERTWLIDGRDDSITSGTVFQLTLTWKNGRKMIEWRPNYAATREPHPHEYAVCGSWNNFKPTELELKRSDSKMKEYEATFLIGEFGSEAFHFIRDKDSDQIIHPAFLPEDWKVEDPKAKITEAHYVSKRKTTDAAIPVRGPDRYGKGKDFVVTGTLKDEVTIILTIRGGQIRVQATCSSRTGSWSRTWMGFSGPQRRGFYITGTFNSWGFAKMEHRQDQPGSFAVDLLKSQLGSMNLDNSFFQVIEDKDTEQIMCPTTPEAGSGEAVVLGPAKFEVGFQGGRCWRVRLSPGAQGVRIVLDTRQRDRRKTVTWQEIFYP